MKKQDKNAFNIQKNTLRELNSNEINHVAGGTGVTVDVVTGIIRVVTVTIGLTTMTTTTGNNDQN